MLKLFALIGVLALGFLFYKVFGGLGIILLTGAVGAIIVLKG